MSAATLIKDYPETTVHSVIETVKGLIAVMSREIELLRAMQIQEMSQLQKEKLDLVNSYEQSTAQLRSNPSFMQHLDPLLKEELRDVIKQMNHMVKENEIALLAAKASNERLMQAIVTAVKQQKQQDSSSYSNSGILAAQSAKSSSPMHLNQCL
ncbi:hypothetical protein O4H49_06910 [Kiloniella laminariae]|uniref:Flagellar basal-body protein FlbY n=1 Tax=Kiloniella laminariae TaxID=454162 RepID=A0ABT4LHS9_9PROT|nr:hypothetical protein [Kiloniella laminariae]MCZ4280500.1 hypothetical protein [Kiloniella laminariae]